MLFDLLAALLILATLPGTLELLFLTVSAWFSRPRSSRSPIREATRLAVIIPAHNESLGIRASIESVLACEPPSTDWALYVIADNCTDDTAKVAAAAGANVLVRDDLELRGKGHALDFAFRRLLEDRYDAFIVVDADSRVEPGFLKAFAAGFGGGADGLQCIYRALDDANDTKARLRSLLWYAFNVVRPRGREFWRLSVGLLGNGFGLTREVLSRVPYEVASITEDLDYHLRLVSAGFRVEFLPGTTVRAPLPAGDSAADTQRARWEGGRFQAIREWTPRLIAELARGRTWALELLLELWLLPLSYHVLLLLVLLLLPNEWGRAYALLALFAVGLHVVTAVRLGGRWRDLGVFAQAPLYLLWKLKVLPAVIAKAGKGASWVRTDRSE